MHDFRTVQHHQAPKTRSDLLYKGAVANSARSVYSGLIRVEKGARGTNAMQTNRNLVLHEGAHADSVPNLEIEDNDVRCSHASAVGPIAEDQRFYLESRGVPTEVADRLIALGFLDEVLEQLPFPALAGALRVAAGRQAATPPTPPRRARPGRPRRAEGAVMAELGRIRADKVEPGHGRAPRRRPRRGLPGAHRRRLLRHRRPLQPRRLLAVGGRHRRRGCWIECWKHGSAFSLMRRAAPVAAGHPARPRLPGAPGRRRRGRDRRRIPE